MKKCIREILPFIIAAAFIWCSVDADAKRVKTTRNLGREKIAESADQALSQCDTIVLPQGDVVISGYDKPLRSRRESMFITNNLEGDISALVITTGYFDKEGREIHERSVKLDTEIPSGSTRRIEYSSWDTQQQFYYIKSQRPRRSAIPYDVKQRVDTVFVQK